VGLHEKLCSMRYWGVTKHRVFFVTPEVIDMDLRESIERKLKEYGRGCAFAMNVAYVLSDSSISTVVWASRTIVTVFLTGSPLSGV
jgi:hypothetical protein